MAAAASKLRLSVLTINSVLAVLQGGVGGAGLRNETRCEGVCIPRAVRIIPRQPLSLRPIGWEPLM
jgi:hypothetical protein